MNLDDQFTNMKNLFSDQNVKMICKNCHEGKTPKLGSKEWQEQYDKNQQEISQLLEWRDIHDKEHRKQYDVPPAFCPLCTGKKVD